MGLVTEKHAVSYDLTQIGFGYLLWGKHRSWNEGKAGIVTGVTKDTLFVQYYPGLRNVMNHFVIPVSEVADGQWEIRWSADMTGIQEYGIKADGDETEGDDGDETEGDDGGETGGTDL